MPEEDDTILSLFGIEYTDPPKAQPKKTKPSRPTGDFKTTRRIVGGEEQAEGQYRATMVFGGMVLEIPEDALLAWIRGMEGGGWSALRYDEHQDIVGGMREIARRMGVAPKLAAKRMDKRAAEKSEDEPDLDKLLDDL